MITRRRFFKSVSATSIALALESSNRMASAQGLNDVYRNPIMGGDHPDASPIRVGRDYYLTHSSFDYAPGIIWYSLDLINWSPVAAALRRYYGEIWAPYLCEYNGHFYIYFPSNFRKSSRKLEAPTSGSIPKHSRSRPMELSVTCGGTVYTDPVHLKSTFPVARYSRCRGKT